MLKGSSYLQPNDCFLWNALDCANYGRSSLSEQNSHSTTQFGHPKKLVERTASCDKTADHEPKTDGPPVWLAMCFVGIRKSVGRKQ